MQINIDGKTIIFNVQYSKRKKFLLETSPEGHINLKSPSSASEDQIMSFVKSHSKSLLDFQEKLENRKYISNQKCYHEAETFLYMGKACNLSDILDNIPNSEDDTQALLKKFYTTKTKDIIKQRVKHFEKIIGVKSKSVTIVDSPYTWGTCLQSTARTYLQL